MELNKVKALITGGSQGIGLETAKLLVTHGAQVAICGRNADRLREASTQSGAFPLVADVSVEAEVVKMIQQVIQEFGDYNVLINNAGFGYFSQLVDLNLDSFQKVLNTNLLGACLCARESAKYFIEKNHGNIVNVASTAAKSGFSGGSAYCASKFAMSALTECWRNELRVHNIRVMQINPSEVQTQFVVNSGRPERPFNETKLRASEIAHAIASMLEMDDRGFVTELTVFATNPK